MERTQQLSDEVREQVESRHHTLQSMIDLASKISTSQASLLSGLKDAKHVFGQLEPVSENSLGLLKRHTALQVILLTPDSVHCCIMITTQDSRVTHICRSTFY